MADDAPAPTRNDAVGLRRAALTGGIATGKSHCLRMFASLGVPVIDADVLAHAAVAVGTPGLAAVAARFGRGVLQPDGSLDRGALANVVFGEDAARRDLEAIVHPIVYAAIQDWFAAEARAGARLALADIPLLYETGHERDFDVVFVAACSPDEQLRRLMARDGLSEPEARRRIATQLPIDDKRRRADYVIDTSGTKAETDGQIERLMGKLKVIGGNRVIGESG